MPRFYSNHSFAVIAAVVLALQLAVCGCQQKAPKQVLPGQNILNTDTLYYDCIAVDQPINFIFKNNSFQQPATLNFYSLNGVNYCNASTMLSSTIHTGMSDEEKALAIWRMVAVSGFDYSFPYNHRLQDNVDPKALVTFPYFLCGEKAGMVANLAAILGLESHIVVLKGHVVAEIKYDNGWHMFDASENCFFKNEAGKIVSVEELNNNTELICEAHIKYALNDNFHGFDKYKSYIKNYAPGWIETTPLITDYSFPSTAFMLYPQDELCFQLSPTSWWVRWLNKRYLFNTKGILARKISMPQANAKQMNDWTIVFTEDFPYFIKLLRIKADEGVTATVYFECENRETLKTERTELGKLTGKNILLKKFDAPAKPEIYYSYRLLFESISKEDVKKITVEHEFEFNSLTFPLHLAGAKVITTDITGQKNISFQITQ